MSAPPPRQRLDEFFLEITLTGRKHIVVEGRADQLFIRAWLDDHSDAKWRVPVTTVDSLEVKVADVFNFGLTEGNRSRVIVVAAIAKERKVNLRCIADRDCGHDVEKYSFDTLVWTDFPAVESYVVEPKALEKANLLSFGGFLPPASELLEQLSFALSELFAVRCRHQYLQTPNYKAGLKGRRATLDKFDVVPAVPAEIRHKVPGYKRPSASDPREYAYGHDIGELLLAAYANELQNKAGLMGLKAVEAALRSAIQAAGTFVQEPLFVELARWIEADSD